MDGVFQIAQDLRRDLSGLEDILRQMPLRIKYNIASNSSREDQPVYAVDYTSSAIRIQSLCIPNMNLSGLDFSDDENHDISGIEVGFDRHVRFRYKQLDFVFDMVSGNHPDYQPRRPV